MTKRKAISKKLRFEVFKRDSFTCQYCGNKAPDVILEIDHINPVSKGGKNSILNLITSCFDCNRGKSDRIISENTVLSKEMEQMSQINEKREQLRMINQWREELLSIEDEQVNFINSYIEKRTNLLAYGSEINTIKKYLKKYGYKNVLDAFELSIDKYWEGSRGRDEDWLLMLQKTGGILYLNSQPEERKKLSYIKGIARNRFSNYKEHIAAIVLDRYLLYYKDYDELIEWTKVASSFRIWENELWEWIFRKEDKNG